MTSDSEVDNRKMYGAIWIIITRSPVTLDFQLIFIEFRVEFVTEKFNKNQLKVEGYGSHIDVPR